MGSGLEWPHVKSVGQAIQAEGPADCIPTQGQKGSLRQEEAGGPVWPQQPPWEPEEDGAGVAEPVLKGPQWSAGQ